MATMWRKRIIAALPRRSAMPGSSPACGERLLRPAPRCAPPRAASPSARADCAPTSASLAATGPCVTRVEARLGRGLAARQMARARRPRGRYATARNCFTIRSSSEWNVTTASRPPGRSTRSAACSARTSSPSSSLTAMRRRLEHAGRGMDAAGLGPDEAGDELGELARRLDAAPCGARSMTARATARARRSSPIMVEDVGELGLGGALTRSAALSPVALHAHVERPVAAEREAALGLVELHRRHADVEHDAVDASSKPASATTRSRSPKRPGTSTSRPFAFSTSAGAAGDRIGIAVDRDDAGAAVCGEDGPACSRRPRRCRRRRRRRGSAASASSTSASSTGT